MKKRTTVLVAAFALLLVGVVGGTLAYFTSNAAITNKFATAQVEITLEEPSWDASVTPKLIPGAVIAKDPQVTLNADSEESYVFIKLNNGLSTVADLNIDTKNWTLVDAANSIYRYNTTLKASEKTQALFTSVSVKTDVAADAMANLASTDIVVNAFAIQKANVTPELALDQAQAFYGLK